MVAGYAIALCPPLRTIPVGIAYTIGAHSSIVLAHVIRPPAARRRPAVVASASSPPAGSG